MTQFAEQKLSEVLYPPFAAELQSLGAEHEKYQDSADFTVWDIASRVNEWWDEHKTAFADKKQYYEECSRVINHGRRIKRLTDSGETLRRWCNVVARYAEFPNAEALFHQTSFEHLRLAAVLARDEKVKSPIEAVNTALERGYSADEMFYHFAPAQPVHPYDDASGKLDAMLDRGYWKWLKSPKTIKRVLELVNEIKKVIEEDR